MFINRLNAVLKKRNMTGNQLCKILNIPNANYTNWKKQPPKAETLKKIANELDVSIDWLMEREHAEEPEETELLSLYRRADERGKKRIYNAAKEEAQLQEKN